jgi:hypothetical protein
MPLPVRGETRREITVSLTVPDAAWRISIEAVYRSGQELWVVSRVRRTPGMAAQVISSVSDRVTLDVPDLPVKHFVLGKTWRWENKETVTFIDDEKTLNQKLKNATLLYRKINEDTPGTEK